MGGFGGWIGLASRSLLHNARKSRAPPHPACLPSLLTSRAHEASAPFARTISYLSPFFYKCSVDIHGRLDLSRTPFNSRFFHSTGFRCMIERDYYELLGVPKDATRDDIKKAFHALAKKYHPDANRNSPAAKRKFQEIRDAYEILQDPEKRADYDRIFYKGAENVSHVDDDAKEFRNTYQDPFSDNFYRIFSEVFEYERETNAPDIQVELNLSFPEAAEGCTKHVSFNAKVICDSCYGRGHPTNAKPLRCRTCNGIGRVTVFPFTSTCSSCKGMGKIIKDWCPGCKGSGVVDSVKNVNVTIPAGVDSGDTIHVPKAGNQGGQGVRPGNLVIKLKIANDAVFRRDGADIYVDTRISFTQAILGGKIEVPTLSGKTQVKIPKGVQPGQLLVLRGRGLPKHIGLVDHGDQYVRFHVHFPSSVNERQRTLLEEFAKEEVIQENNRFMEGNLWQQIIENLTGPTFMLVVGSILLIHLLLTKV